MNNIDILEELKKEFDGILKEPIGQDEMPNGNLYEYERDYELDLEEINAISNLIAENKELKEENLHWKGQYHLLSRKIDVIPKSKVEEILKKYKYTEIEDSEKIIQFYKDLQSLLGKE